MHHRRWGVAACALALLMPLVACTGDPAASPPGTTVAGAGECDWPMWGHNLSRTFAYPCPTDISPDTVGDLTQAWFFNTYDVVTATPAVVDGVAYVGDWSGRFYALDAETGTPRWTFQAATQPNVYAGNIVSSAAVADLDGTQVVLFASGRTLYALDTADGTERWHHDVGAADGSVFVEIESSPAVADGKVIVGIDAHNQPEPTGVLAVDLHTGEQSWRFDLEGGQPSGCGDVWSSPSVDLERNLVFAGSGNCPSSPDGWGHYTEALFALDLGTGRPRWSYQPHDPNNDDLDFAGAPNLFTTSDGRDLVGLGNKDGTYYAVDRDTGELAWKVTATGPGLEKEGGNFSTGGFIGPTAYSDGVIAGGTAVGPAPFVNAFTADDGTVLWQDSSVQAVYGASAIANGVLFVGNNDFTFRAYDLHTGEKLWQHEMSGAAAGGTAIVGNDVFTVAGIREPGLEKRSETSGVYKFTLPAPGQTIATSSSSTTTTGPRATDVVLEPNSSKCVGTPCQLFGPDSAGLSLKPDYPPGTDPKATLLITTDPFSATITATGLGDPAAWLPPGSPAAQEGATVYGLFASERDDNPVGGLLCVLDASGTCTADSLPRLTSYNRFTLLAIAGPDSPLPSAQEGVARLLVTTSFDPPLTPVGG